MCGLLMCMVAHVWQLTCTAITNIWWRGALMCGSYVAINVYGNYYYMVEGSPHMWQLTCMVITTTWWRGPPHVWPINMHCSSCVAINMHSNY